MTKALDINLMMDMVAAGIKRKDIAEALGVSAPTISNKIDELKREESALLAYDKNKHLDLISVQQRLVAGITDDKILEAPLGQIAQAYGVFNKAEQLATGRPTEIRGLMGYLMHLEKEDIAAAQGEVVEGEVSDGAT